MIKICETCGSDYFTENENEKRCSWCKGKKKREYNHKYYEKRKKKLEEKGLTPYKERKAEYYKDYYKEHKEEMIERALTRYYHTKEIMDSLKRDPLNVNYEPYRPITNKKTTGR